MMSEHGKAMMGTATAAGTDRARIAAEQAVASPLLEGVDLSGARGVLVNITANSSLKLRETTEVMNTIRAFAADDATVIFGTVTDDAMADELRVTVVATGLGRAADLKRPALVPMPMQKTGTDNMRMTAPPTTATRSGSEYDGYDTPAVWRERPPRVTDDAHNLEIPAFLRKQAD